MMRNVPARWLPPLPIGRHVKLDYYVVEYRPGYAGKVRNALFQSSSQYAAEKFAAEYVKSIARMEKLKIVPTIVNVYPSGRRL